MGYRRTSRREVIAGAAAVSAAALASPALAQSGARVIVVGGGFAGADCARTLKRASPRTAVTLIEANATFTACPLANAVLAGLRPLRAQQFDYKRIAAEGIT